MHASVNVYAAFTQHNFLFSIFFLKNSFRFYSDILTNCYYTILSLFHYHITLSHIALVWIIFSSKSRWMNKNYFKLLCIFLNILLYAMIKKLHEWMNIQRWMNRFDNNFISKLREKIVINENFKGAMTSSLMGLNNDYFGGIFIANIAIKINDWMKVMT